MRAMLAGLGLALMLGACAGGVAPQIGMLQPASGAQGGVTATSPNIVAAVSDTRRPDTDRARDELRHPADILAFAGVRPGMRVADVGTGAGYYTRLFAVAVGDTGRVYGLNRAPNPQATQPPAIRAVATQYPNITVVEQGYVGWSLPEQLDVLFVSQIYHDFWFPVLNADPAAFNRAVFAALKPGGVYVIIDHAGAPGMAMSTDPQASLHRIDQAVVRQQVEAAGFVYDGETQVLRNPADNRALRVFEGDIRGHTDQFAMRFRKPN